MAEKTIQPSSANVTETTSLVHELTKAVNALRNRPLRNPGLRIKGGSGSALVQNENTFEALVNDTIVRKTQSDMPALSGTVSNGEFGVWLFTINSSGTLSSTTLVTGASIGAVTLPTLPADEALVGGVLVNPTGTGDFVGGTTDLDDGTVTPNAVFYQGQQIVGLGTYLNLRGFGVVT